MDLKEYLSQKDPVRMPTVYLKPNEYRIGATMKCGYRETRTQVFLDFGDHELSGTEYVLKNDWDVLYTVDQDGNAKNMSCFRINKEQK